MVSFQFLGIPPKGEPFLFLEIYTMPLICFQFLGIPPKGELDVAARLEGLFTFPISRDPPEGGTLA